MDKTQVIYTELTACQDCYKCLRECPVKAIQIVNGHARVMAELCIHCGHCVEVCPQKAKKVRNDLEKAKVLVRLRPKVVLSLAPSFAAEFADIPVANFIAACRRLGFSAVSETSLGADLVSFGMNEDIEERHPAFLISSACPSVVQYINKYEPEMRSFLSASCSPMMAHARFLKAMLGTSTAVIFAGPCIAKKWEADMSAGTVDVALTFRELKAWFEEERVDFGAMAPTEEDRLFPGRAGHGVLYPIEGGMVSSIRNLGCSGVQFMTFSGIQQIKGALKGVECRKSGDTLFLELLACEGGCINGPQTGEGPGTVIKRLQVLSYRTEEDTAVKQKSHTGPKDKWDTLLAMPQNLYESEVLSQYVPEERIREALASIGKYSRKDELNCSGCGYDSCRAFASAMILGKAEKTMCLSYMRNLAQKKANALLKTMPSAAVVVDSSMRIVESNKPFAELLGKDIVDIYDIKPSLEGADLRKLLPFWQAFEQVLRPGGTDLISSDFRCNDKIVHGSVFSIEKGLLAGGLFQDITAPWIQKDRVIAQAKKVMHQNLKTVQKIAYLLGENAAEAEAALTSIIESFQPEDPRDLFVPHEEDRS